MNRRCCPMTGPMPLRPTRSRGQRDVPGVESMSLRTPPPFRADHVGSFLRPRYLLEARERRQKGEIGADELRRVEDRAITEIVKFQEDVGLKSITDGEFRRTYFHIDFLDQLGGVKTDVPVMVKKPDGSEELAPPVMRVVDKVRHVKEIQRADLDRKSTRLNSSHRQTSYAVFCLKKQRARVPQL